MLSELDNQELCRVGPGTLMGNLFRQYWIPAVRSDELPAPDSPPVRIKLLNEELIAFRATSGKVGLVQNACPHRGASLFFGRNEEEGLRCVYHGWKFDVTGACVDMPSEPAESNFKNKVRARAYPTQERGGIIWAYMGPREVPPPLPELAAILLNEDPERISILLRPNNWLQGIEGEMDTIHAAILHWGMDQPGDPGSFSYYHFTSRFDARFTAKDSPFGASYGCYRPAEEDTYYWRVGHVLFPFIAMQANGELGPEERFNAYVPVDDYNTLQWELQVRTDGKTPRMARTFPINRTNEPQAQGALRTYMPQGTGWLDRFVIQQSGANDYLIDREVQKTSSYTGIPGVRQQDMAMTESMGPIMDRTNEHLGTSDSMIIKARRRWLAAARALAEHGVVPPGVDEPQLYHQRSGEVILPRNVDWWDGTRELRESWTPEAAKIAAEVAGGGG
jgi:phenylpropionate dioxygenase-like ring-hydroxylating dioxygenase large terminal subunit